jgi:hypothetical protein
MGVVNPKWDSFANTVANRDNIRADPADAGSAGQPATTTVRDCTREENHGLCESVHYGNLTTPFG